MHEQDSGPDASTQPVNPARRRIFQAAAAAGVVAGAGTLPGVASTAPTAAKAPARSSLDAKLRAHVKNVVVIYLENRSFNNLFADFPGLAEPLAGVPAARLQQRDRDGSVLPTLPNIWGGMVPALCQAMRMNCGP